VNWDYQSNGWCTDACNAAGTYAFAVILAKECWCSNYIPGDQRDTGDCNSDCPGFPDEKCGNTDDNLYSYLKLKGKPSGTVGGSQSTSANVSPSTTTTTTTASSTQALPSLEVTTVSTALFIVSGSTNHASRFPLSFHTFSLSYVFSILLVLLSLSFLIARRLT
jgi:cell wall integrity and stress response component